MFDAEETRRQSRQGDAEQAAEALLAAAGDERTRVRNAALEAAPSLENAEALLPRLEAALRDGGNAARRNAARSVFAALAGPEANAAALQRLERLATTDDDRDVRVLAASALGETANSAALPALVRALRDADANVAAAAADAVGTLGAPGGVDSLAALLSGDDPWRGTAAAVALGRLGEARALPALAAALADPAVGVVAAGAIGEIRDPAGLDALRPALESADRTLRRTALDAAAAILGAHPKPAPPWLREAARTEESWFTGRWQEQGDPAAALLLGVVGTATAARHLLHATEADPDRMPAAAAALPLLPEPIAFRTVLPYLERHAAPEPEPSAIGSASEADFWNGAQREELLSALPPLPDRATAERVARLLANPNPEFRAVVAEVLARARPEADVRALLTELLGDKQHRVGAVLALGRLPAGACDLLSHLLDDADTDVRCAAAEGIARCPAPDVAPHIITALQREPDSTVRRSLIAALGAVAGPDAVDALAPLAREGDAGARFAAVRALGRTRAPAALPHLLDALATGDPMLEAAALQALGDLGSTGGTDALVHHLDSGSRESRRLAAGALWSIAPAAATRRLIAALADKDWRVRLAAARTLTLLDAPDAVEPLRTLRDSDPDPLVRRAAASTADREG